MPNLASNLPGLHEVSTLHSVGLRSIPSTPKSAFLELYLRQNEKERLIKQEKRATRQEKQFRGKLASLDKTMAKLFKTASAVMKGQNIASVLEKNDSPEKRKGMVLGYPK
ncbi:MAG: hypothetical protein KKF30_19260 [Proteobacteria bacterium]|nr:hypothetical protein [Pseudomonadota bacterium]